MTRDWKFTSIWIMFWCFMFRFCLVTGDGDFVCRSNLHYDFRNIDRFTDNMCAQCVWFMAADEEPWQDSESVHQWRVEYNFSATVNVMLCTPNCTEFNYKQLYDSENYVVKQFRSTYYLVTFFYFLLVVDAIYD